jgi:isochorismate synthase
MTERTPRWIRIQETIDLLDPWTLLPPLQDDGARLMAWSAPSKETSFVAVGAVLEFRPTGAHRFDDARSWWQPIADEMQTRTVQGKQIESQTPACVAGFAFRNDNNRSDEWAAWGDGALCVPEILIWSTAKQTVAVYTIDTHHAPMDVQLQAKRQRLDSWRGRAHAQHSPVANGQVQSASGVDDAWEAWRTGVESAQATMANGTLRKVVLARSQAFEPADAQRFDPLATAWALRERQINSTTFLIRRKDGQAFLGSSPETLVHLKDGQVETVALAGTRRRNATSTEEDDALSAALFDSEKDRHEQELVTEAILDALQPYVDELHSPQDPEIVRHPDVQHLRTAIHGRLAHHATIFELVKQLHPTPAVGGLPKESALAWLDHHEHLDRGWYAGPIGWISSDGEGEFVVAIRSVLMAGHTASAFAGCGLVVSSNPADEWEESQVKLQTVRQGLAFQPSVDR